MQLGFELIPVALSKRFGEVGVELPDLELQPAERLRGDPFGLLLFGQPVLDLRQPLP